MSLGRTLSVVAACVGPLFVLAFARPIAAEGDGATAPPHSLSGVVHDLESRSVPGARVSASLVGANGTIESRTVLTDGDGRFSIEFPPLLEIEPRALDAAGFDVRVIAPGFLPSGARLNVARDGLALAPGGTRAEMKLEPGAAIRVRVAMPDGTPAASTPVHVVARDSLPLGRHGHGVTDDLGRFDFPIERAGRFEVFAEATGVGKAASGAFDVTAAGPGSDVDLDELLLDPGGVVEAIVVLPDGSPVSGLLVRAAAVPAATARSAGYGVTDDAGRLRIAGLDPGSYALVPTLLDSDDVPVPADADGRFPVAATGAEPARVEAAIHVLTLCARDADGQPLTGLAVFATRIDAERLPDFTRAWEKGDRRAVADIEDACRFTCGMTLGPTGDRCVLFLEPGGAYLFRSRQADNTAARRIEPGVAFVRVPLVPGRSTVDLVAGLEGAQGRVRLLVTDAAGEPVTGGFVCTLVPRADDANTGGFRWIAPDADGLLPPVDPGPYRIGAEPDPKSPVCFAAHWGDCVVRAGEETLVAVTARPAARLRLRFVAPERSAGVLLRNVTGRVGRDSLILPVFDALATAGEMGIRAGEWILSRSAHAPGASTLSIEVDGYEKATREVTLEAGAVADVEITLEPRR